MRIIELGKQDILVIQRFAKDLELNTNTNKNKIKTKGG
jgi:hypothetical protein